MAAVSMFGRICHYRLFFVYLHKMRQRMSLIDESVNHAFEVED